MYVFPLFLPGACVAVFARQSCAVHSAVRDDGHGWCPWAKARHIDLEAEAQLQHRSISSSSPKLGSFQSLPGPVSLLHLPAASLSTEGLVVTR